MGERSQVIVERTPTKPPPPMVKEKVKEKRKKLHMERGLQIYDKSFIPLGILQGLQFNVSQHVLLLKQKLWVWEAEILAVILGLKLALQNGLVNCILEMNSQFVVQILQCAVSWHWKYYTSLVRAHALLTSRDYQIRHVYREANSVTDNLSRIASAQHVTSLFRLCDLHLYVKVSNSFRQGQFLYFRTKITQTLSLL